MILDIQSQLDQIDKIRSGEIKEGLALGVNKTFDTYFRFKEGSFNVFCGHSNVGKTHFCIYLMFLFTLRHNIRWLVYTAENEPYSIVKKLIEYKEGLPINKIEEKKLKELGRWVDLHFKFISIDETQTYKTLLDLGTEIKKSWDYQGFLIDPYNSLDFEKDLYRSVGGHQYDYLVATQIRLFCHKTKVAVWLTAHAHSEALRKVHPTNHEYAGYPVAPKMSDIEGGGKWGNRCSNFISVHRMVQHPMDWMVTEMHVLKVKNTDTGMMPTSLLSPVKLRSIPNNVGFSIEGENLKELIDEYTGKSSKKA